MSHIHLACTCGGIGVMLPPLMSHTHLACTCGSIGVMMSHAAPPDESHTPGVHVRRHRCADESCCRP